MRTRHRNVELQSDRGASAIMFTAVDNTKFWESDTALVAVCPYRPADAEGLVAFAATSDEMRNLLYFATSGSEGVPKWVALSRAAFLHSARAVNQHLEATSEDRWLIALPLFHVGGFSILARCHESGSVYSIMEGRWDAKRFVHACRNECSTLTSLVPTQLHDLVKERLPAPPTLRAVVIGGSALTRDLGLRAVELGWPVLQTYGMTEACSQIATEPLAHLHSGFDPDILEVLPGWNLETDRNDALYIRGPALASGYVTRRDWRHRTWMDDVRLPQSQDLWRWAPIDPASGLVTRDHVQLWWHGARQFLRFMARGSSFVKVLGELVNLVALQARLDGIAVSLGSDGDNAVIFPMPDERKGCRLVLVGEPPVKQLDALRKRYNKQSAGCERLDESIHVAALPRTSIGKLDREALRSQLAGK